MDSSRVWLRSSAIPFLLICISAIRGFASRENGVGCAVATATIERIESSQIFIDDNFILNRLSFVFGFGKSTEYEGKGIFFITEAMVERVNMVVQDLGINTHIEGVFHVNFTTITYDEMAIAINAGIAIMILLQEEGNLPERYDIQDQAKLVAEIYGYSFTSDFYLDYVKYATEFDKDPVGNQCMQCKPQGTDLIFMVDVSASINDTEWDYQKEFVMNFSRMQDIGVGDDQVRIGFVFYSIGALKIPFSFIFEWMETRSLDMLGAIEFFLDEEAFSRTKNYQTYPGTAFMAAEDFILKGRKTGSRIDDDNIRKVLVVLTDGKATDRPNLQKQYTKFRQNVPQYKIYGVGITGGADMGELLYMTDYNIGRVKKYKSYKELSKDVPSIIQMTCKSDAYLPIRDNKNKHDRGPSVVIGKYKLKYGMKIKTVEIN